MKKKIKMLFKNKRFVIFLALFIVFIVCLLILGGIFVPGHGSNYGNRLDGIKEVGFDSKAQDKVVNSIKKDDKVKTAKINVHGKIVNVIFDVNKDVSIDDSRAIANASLEKFSKKTKEFYDIQFLITKTDEEGEEVQVQKEDGKTATEIKKSFPIMGYKNAKSDRIVW